MKSLHSLRPPVRWIGWVIGYVRNPKTARPAPQPCQSPGNLSHFCSASMSAINRYLLEHNLRIATNPCISPDFCLDWQALSDHLRAGKLLKVYPKSRFETKAGAWTLLEASNGDCAWRLQGGTDALHDGIDLADGTQAFPATFANLLRLKNLVQEHNPRSTIFPTAADQLGASTLGIGARFTTLHWPAVDWAMSALSLGVTANQNSIPRELVYDVNVMLAGKLDA